MTEIKLPPLARWELDRDYLSRSKPELFDELWSLEGTRVLAMHGGKVLLRADSETPKLNLMPVDQVPTANLRVYLGKTTSATSHEDNGAAIVLAIVNENSANQIEPDGSKWIGLRSLGAELSDRDAGLFTQALALYNWHETNQHCPKCGTPTVIEQGGWARRCFKDNNEIFPRTDPAIIVVAGPDAASKTTMKSFRAPIQQSLLPSPISRIESCLALKAPGNTIGGLFLPGLLRPENL